MRILFMGTPDFAVPVLEKLAEAGHDVVGVVTQPDRPAGRGKHLQFSPVKQAALKRGIPVLQPERIREISAIEAIADLEPDVAVVVAYGQILPQTVLELPEYGCINVHASLLPAYRGAAPIQWSILRGEEKTGVTIMQMDAGLDTGDILSQEEIPIEPDETGGSLHDKLSVLGADLLVRTLKDLEEGRIKPVPQGETTTPYASMLTRSMGNIDWTAGAKEIERQVRSLSPWPGAYFFLDGKRCKLWKASAADSTEYPEANDAFPGEVALRTDRTLLIAAGEGYLSLLEVQMEGKRRMEIAEFLRGVREIRIDLAESDR